MRVYFLNNYAMQKAHGLFKLGVYPGHHLWGYSERLTRDEWTIPPSLYDRDLHGNAALTAIRNAIVRFVGDPKQQIHAIARTSGSDVIYAADQRSAIMIGLLKRLRVVRARYVVIVHHPPRRALELFSLRGADQILVLSNFAARQTEIALRNGHVPSIAIAPWGPELESPLYQIKEGGSVDLDFVAAGRTNRDYDSLRQAAKIGRLNGMIFDAKGQSEFRHGSVSNIKGRFEYPEIVAAMKRASCIVIPLRDPGVMAGLTEVADAIALDIPLIVSKSVAFPYDLSAQKAGCFLEDGTVGELLGRISDAKQGKIGSAGAMRDQFNTVVFSRLLNDALSKTI